MPAQHSADLKKTYAKIASGFEGKHSVDTDFEGLEYFLSLLSKKEKVLDLGSGTGRDSQWLTDHGCDVTMFDLSPEMLAIASTKAPKATVVQGDMMEMDFKPNSFDGVWARASLLHVTKEEGQVVSNKVFDILKNGGVFFCTIKEGEGEKEVTDSKYGQEATRFFSFYTQKEAEEMLKKAGFAKVTSDINVSSSNISWVRVIGVKN